MAKINQINKTAKGKKETPGKKHLKGMYLEMLCGLLEPEGRVSIGPGFSFQVLAHAFCFVVLNKPDIVIAAV